MRSSASVPGRWRHADRRPVAAVAGALAAAATVAATAGVSSATALPLGCTQSGTTVTCTFSETGVSQTFTVPGGVRSLKVIAVGGKGGAAVDDPSETVDGSGGFGAVASGQMAVTAGATLEVLVAGNGSDGTTTAGGSGGFNGGGSGAAYSLHSSGGGGGASELVSADTPLLVAGGGGGGGDGGFSTANGGNGGSAGATAQAGGDGANFIGPTDGGSGGAPGTDSAGGAGGAAGTGGNPAAAGTAGTAGQGGSGQVSTYTQAPGGGGGSGYFGGGGGGSGAYVSGYTGGGGGGGAGSSYASAAVSGAQFATDTTGTPQITIAYTLPQPAPVVQAPLKISKVSLSKSAVVWCWGQGCRYPSTKIRFTLNRKARVRLVLQANARGKWKQVAISTVNGHSGANSHTLAGRWHGHLVPKGKVRILVQIKPANRWETRKTLKLTVRHKRG